MKVTNLWPNRLIGDEYFPEDCSWKTSVQSDNGYPIAEWPDWLSQDKPSPAGRTTFTTWKHWHKDSPLLESGLLGPVTLRDPRATHLALEALSMVDEALGLTWNLRSVTGQAFCPTSESAATQTEDLKGRCEQPRTKRSAVLGYQSGHLFTPA